MAVEQANHSENKMSTYLSCNGVASRRKQLGYTRCFETGFCEAKGSPQPGTASPSAKADEYPAYTDAMQVDAHNNGIVLVFNERIIPGRPGLANDS